MAKLNQALVTRRHGAKIVVKKSAYSQVSYEFIDDHTVVFSFAGKEIARFDNVSEGDGFVVNQRKDRIEVSKLKIPHRNADLLLWFFDVPRNKGAHTYIEYELQLEKCRAALAMEFAEHKEFSYEGHGYAFTYGSLPNISEPITLAGYVAEDADKALAREIFRNKMLVLTSLVYDRELVTRLLAERFGFTPSELAELGLTR